MIGTWNTIKVTNISKHLVHVALHRPTVLNAFSTEMARELTEVFTTINNSEDYRSVILSGHGDHFCVGADLKERNDLSFDQWKAQHEIFRDATQSILNTKIPVIVAAQGYCVGAGLELSLCADLFVASPHATFGLPETKLGIFPGIGGTPLMARLGGSTFAKRMIFTGDLVDTDELYKQGVVHWTSESCDSVLDLALQIGERVASRNPYSIQQAKRALNADMSIHFDESMKYSLDLYMDCARRSDREEGVRAFVEKREPNWNL